MKKLLAMFLVTLFLIACNDTHEVEKNEPLNLILKTTDVVPFDNSVVIDKIKKRNSGRLAQQVDYSSAQVVSFEGTSIMGVITPIDETKTLFNYVNTNNEMSHEQIVHETVTANGTTTSNFYDVDGNLLFYLAVDGDDIRIFKGKSQSAKRFFRENGLQLLLNVLVR